MPTPDITPLEHVTRKVLDHAQVFLAPMYARRDAVIRIVAQEFGVPLEEMTGGVSTHAVLKARRVAVALAVEFLCRPFTREAVAGFFHISEGTLYRFTATVRECESSDADFARRMNELRARIRETIQQAEARPTHSQSEDKPNG